MILSWIILAQGFRTRFSSKISECKYINFTHGMIKFDAFLIQKLLNKVHPSPSINQSINKSYNQIKRLQIIKRFLEIWSKIKLFDELDLTINIKQFKPYIITSSKRCFGLWLLCLGEIQLNFADCCRHDTQIMQYWTTGQPFVANHWT